MTDITSPFTPAQTEILLRGINASRIEKRKQAGMQLSYLSQADVRAHLIRIFGYGNFDLETLHTELAYEEHDDGKWRVGYRVTMRLTVRGVDGRHCVYSETAVGSSSLPQRGEAHDMAMKTASSDAMKRCAINLGDQFGLSLYQQGQTAPLVKATLVLPDAPESPVKAPVAAEQPQHAQEDTPADTAPENLVLELAAIAGLDDSKTRITSVAKFKTKNREHLDSTLSSDGTRMTLARYADLVAAGAYTPKEEE